MSALKLHKLHKIYESNYLVLRNSVAVPKIQITYNFGWGLQFLYKTIVVFVSMEVFLHDQKFGGRDVSGQKSFQKYCKVFSLEMVICNSEMSPPFGFPQVKLIL